MADSTMEISVKTINNESFSYSLPSTTIVSDLKRMLRDSTAIDIPRQRLIFRGRVLQDDLLLTDYSITCGNVLHMVARPAVDTESDEESRRTRSHITSDLTTARPVSHGFAHYSIETGVSTGNNSARHENQLQRLSRNELELFNQLMTGESPSNQESIGGIIIQNQQDLQRQQMYSSDISSYSFQSASRFAVLPTVVAPGAPSSSASLAHANNGPTTSISPRPNMNSSSESVERIRQGLLTMETIISTMDRSVFISNEYFRHPRNPDAATLSEDLTAEAGKSVISSSSTNKYCDFDNDINPVSVFAQSRGDIPAARNSLSNVQLDGTKRKDESPTEEYCREAGNSSGKRKGQSISGQDSVAESSATSGLHAPKSQEESNSEAAAQELSNKSGTAAVAELKAAARELDADFHEVNEMSASHSGGLSEAGTDQRAEGAARAQENRMFFVGQWVDVKDTVSQWLEATVMAVDPTEQRVFVHYNGWPIRWDEWLPFMTTRIAPFRTRTLHSPQYFHTLPTPNAVNLPNARSVLPHPLLLGLDDEDTRSTKRGVGGIDLRDQVTGMAETDSGAEREVEVEAAEERTMDPDSILSLLPTVSRMMRCLQPQIDAAARIAVEVLRTDPEAGDADLTDSRDREFRRIAEDLCPLADRFGRILADLSPLLRALGSSAAPPLSPMGTGISPALVTSNPLSPDYFPAPEHPSNNMLEMSLASLLRPRAPSPPPLRAFRQPISTSAQPPLGLGLRSAVLLGSGSLGIGMDPQNQGSGMPGLGGLRGTTRLGFGGSGGGIFDIHIAVLPPSRRDGSMLSAGNAIPVPLTALSGVAADLATQSLIFVPQEHVPSNVAQAVPAPVESALPSGLATLASTSAADNQNDGSSHGTEVGNEETSVEVTPRSSASSAAPQAFSLILPGASASSDTDGIPTLVDRGEPVGGLNGLSPQSSSVAFSTWLDARREEREMEREIDRLRAMLRNREQEYEEAIRSILSLEGGQIDSTSPAPLISSGNSNVTASIENRTANNNALIISGDRVNISNSHMRTSQHLDNFSSSSNSDSNSNGNSSDGDARDASASGSTAVDPPGTPPAVTEITDTDETSVATPSTAAGSDNSVSTDTGIATATTQVGSREEEDRLTAANSSNSGSRASSVLADSNTQISLSTYSDGTESSEEVFPSTVLLGSSSLDSGTSSSSGSGSDLNSSFHFDLRAAHEPTRAVSNVLSAAATSGSTEGEENAEAESAYAGYDHEKDFESLSSGSISGETIDAYIASKDGRDHQQPRGVRMDEPNANTVIEADTAVSAAILELYPKRGASSAAIKSDDDAQKKKRDTGMVSSTSLFAPSSKLSGSTIPMSSSTTSSSSSSALNMSRSSADQSNTIPRQGSSPNFQNALPITRNREVVPSASDSAAVSVPFQRDEEDGEELEEESQQKLRDQNVDKPRPPELSTGSESDMNGRRASTIGSALHRIRMSLSAFRGPNGQR